MVSSITSAVSPIQLLNATNAFKAVNKKPEEMQEELSEGVNLNDNNSLLTEIDAKDVRKYASMMGESSISDDDIKYGLTYGRSIIADWVV